MWEGIGIPIHIPSMPQAISVKYDSIRLHCQKIQTITHQLILFRIWGGGDIP